MVKREDLFIAGITRVADFPLNPVMAIKFSHYLDYLVLGFDSVGGYAAHNDTDYIDGVTWYELFKRLRPFPPHVTVDMFLAKTGAGACCMGDGFLEEMLRRLDGVMPDIVLECEADASFDYGPAFDKDIEGFINSDADQLWMGNTCISSNGREVPDFPIAPHCRGYKWYPGVYYRDGFCQTRAPGDNPRMDGWRERKLHRDDIPERIAKKYMAETKLQHYPLFTEKLEQERWRYYGKSHAEHIYICAEMDVPDLSYVEKI